MRKTLSLWLFHLFSALQTAMRLFDIFDPCLSGVLAQAGCSVWSMKVENSCWEAPSCMRWIRWCHVHFGSTQQSKLVMKPRQKQKTPPGRRHNPQAWILIWLIWSAWNHEFSDVTCIGKGLKAACFSSELHSREWNTGPGLLAFLGANQFETFLILGTCANLGFCNFRH